MKKIFSTPGIFSFGIILFLLSSCGRLEELEKEQITNYTVEVKTPIDTLEEIQSMEFSPHQNANRFSDQSIVPLLGPMINGGMVLWDIIKSNRPSSSTSSQYANALPSGAKNSMDLTGFSELQTQSFRVYGKNPYGATVYDVTYTLVHRFGGRYQNKGQYLENVSIVPSRVSVLWGYTFNMDVKSANPINVGTTENPIAELSLDMKYSVSTLIKATEKRELFVFRGDSVKASKSVALGSQLAKY